MTSYDPDAAASYFDGLGEAEWSRLVASPVAEVKLHVHTHYLERRLNAGDRILEVGAGAGRFTQVMAKMGVRITVGDISPGQVALNRRLADEHGFAPAVEDWHVLDICDLSQFDDHSFDGVVCYGGPLSYVFDARDQALSECIRVVRPGGLIWTSVMATWGSVHQAFPGVLDAGVDANRAILSTGDITLENLPGSRHHCHMFRADELRSFLLAHGLEILDIAASNCLTTGWDLTDSRGDDSRWAEILRLEIEATREPGCLDMGSHLIAVTRTPG